MKKVVALLLVLGLASLAQASYFMKVNGNVETEITMNVGSSVVIEIWSDSADQMQVEPTAASSYMQNGYNIIAWNADWSGASEAFTNLITNNAAAGWDATGWTHLGVSSPDKYPHSHDTIAFGAPTLMTTLESDLYASWWCTYASLTHNRWARLRVVD